MPSTFTSEESFLCLLGQVFARRQFHAGQQWSLYNERISASFHADTDNTAHDLASERLRSNAGASEAWGAITDALYKQYDALRGDDDYLVGLQTVRTTAAATKTSLDERVAGQRLPLASRERYVDPRYLDNFQLAYSLFITWVDAAIARVS